MSWAKLNEKRYVCEECDYRTHNKSNFGRHRNSVRCFIPRNAPLLPPGIRRLIMAYANMQLYLADIDFIRAYSYASGPPCNRPGLHFYVRPRGRPSRF